MIAAKNDPLRGADAKFEDFLSRFKVKYEIFKRRDFPNRSVLSLYDKFKEIRHDCGQFTSILCKIQDPTVIPPSGTTQSDEDDIEKVCDVDSVIIIPQVPMQCLFIFLLFIKL